MRNTNAYRLIHAEGDLLPGLDRGSLCRLPGRANARQGMDRQTGDVVNALTRLLSPARHRGAERCAVRAKEDLPLETKVLAGEIPPRIDIEMNGLRFTAD